MNFQSIDEIESALAESHWESAALYELWQVRQPVMNGAERGRGANPGQLAWLHEPELAERFIRRALDAEDFLLVCDSAQEALRLESGWDDAEARQHFASVRLSYAHALTRIGATSPAKLQIECLLDPTRSKHLSKMTRAKISAALGDIEREESHHVIGAAGRRRRLERALEHYQRALALDARNVAAALHSAAVLLLLARRSEAEVAAHGALEMCANADAEGVTDGAKFAATVMRAAAHAVLGDISAARGAYSDLATLPGATHVGLAETRHRARLLAAASGEVGNVFDDCFPKLQLIVFSGYQVDLPGKCPRFPASRTEEVRGMIRARLAQLDARVGLVGAAAGADLLFIEEMRARGGTVHIVLPWAREEYLETSVRPFDVGGGPERSWESRFHEALKHAATVRELGQVYQPSDSVSWQYVMEVTAGLAQLTAKALRLDVHPVSLWDGQPGGGGSAAFHSFWSEVQGHPPEVIELPTTEGAAGVAVVHERGRRSERDIVEQQVKSMLFADIVGYSKLTERVIPAFVREFLGRVSERVASSAYAPMSVNTWGDAVYAVFDRTEDAGNFALELVQMIGEAEDVWRSFNLVWEEKVPGEEQPRMRPLNVRVGLHTGPVYMSFDPVVRRLGFTGAHVNRAARIEPVTDAGNVFASEEFAALATLNRAKGFACEFAGTMNLAKGFPGRHRIYRVLPVREFPIEALARAAHNLYCDEARARGETSTTNVVLSPWEELREDYREANRAQVADIPNALNVLGFELVHGAGMRASNILITDAQVEQLAMRQHERFVQERMSQDWTFASVRDNATKKHPLLVPWEQLNEIEKEKDRDTVRNVPKLIALAGFRVRLLPAAETR